jgi:hypothetical protein
MGRFLIYFHRDAGSIDGAVPGKPNADNFMGLLMGNDVIKPETDPLEFRGARMNAYGVVIMELAVIRGPDFNNRVYIAALLDFSIWIRGIAHQ